MTSLLNLKQSPMQKVYEATCLDLIRELSQNLAEDRPTKESFTSIHGVDKCVQEVNFTKAIETLYKKYHNPDISSGGSNSQTDSYYSWQYFNKEMDISKIGDYDMSIEQAMEIAGNLKKDVTKIFLTASGGPFREKPFDEFKSITLKDALNHPTWNMGHKITIDSATLMNKGLEIIEAVHLFNITHEEIEVLVHPQSIVHSMVGYKDGSIMAQMGPPDMKGAISYALSEPDRIDLQMDFPDFVSLGALTFEKPDTQKFPSLEFAFEACKQKGTLPAVMNAANEVAVSAFLEKRIDFLDIFKLISRTMELHTQIDNPDLSGIIEADCWAREKVQSQI